MEEMETIPFPVVPVPILFMVMPEMTLLHLLEQMMLYMPVKVITSSLLPLITVRIHLALATILIPSNLVLKVI